MGPGFVSREWGTVPGCCTRASRRRDLRAVARKGASWRAVCGVGFVMPPAYDAVTITLASGGRVPRGTEPLAPG